MPKSKARKKRTQPRRANEPPQRSRPRWRLGTFEGFDEWLADFWTVRWSGVALLVAIGVAVGFGALVQAKEREQHLFDNAPICAMATDSNCKIEYAATVQDKGRTSGKMPTYYLELTGPQPADGTIDLPDENALWVSAAAGDTVTAVVWNGAVAQLIDGTVTADTAAAPAVATTGVTAVFASCVFWVVACAMFFVRMLQMDYGILARWSRLLALVNPVAMLGMLLFPIGTMVGTQLGSIPSSVAGGLIFTALGAIVVLAGRLGNR